MMLSYNLRLRAILSFLVLAWTALTGAAQEFRLVPTPVHIPERGDVPGMVVLTESNRFGFILPREWRISSTAAEKKITLDAHDFKGTIVVKIVPGPTNAMELPALRDQLAARFPGSKITGEAQCYTCDGRGPMFDLEWAANGNLVTVQIAYVPFPGGIVEFSLTAMPENFGECRLPFGNLLTSFTAEQRLPKSGG